MRGFRLTLTDNELNTVIVALGRMPYDDVFGLIQGIHAQAQAQIARAKAKATPPATPSTPVPSLAPPGDDRH